MDSQLPSTSRPSVFDKTFHSKRRPLLPFSEEPNSSGTFSEMAFSAQSSSLNNNHLAPKTMEKIQHIRRFLTPTLAPAVSTGQDAADVLAYSIAKQMSAFGRNAWSVLDTTTTPHSSIRVAPNVWGTIRANRSYKASTQEGDYLCSETDDLVLVLHHNSKHLEMTLLSSEKDLLIREIEISRNSPAV